ncbi:hypothetical protein [Salipaludibacillus sp. CF4.18]|uniref:hypothetical protein n=1 Tax=Salipaludibacillus sp. CF4.18 TaxID=3373081 RepID=UPI003EE4535A
MELFKLMGSILIDNDKADKSIAKTEKKAEGLSKKLGKGIKVAAKWGGGLAAGAGVAIGGMVALGTKVGNLADEILDLNSQTGLSTDQLQKWRKATEVAGVSTDTVADASLKLTKNLDTMSTEGHKGQEALGKLGLSLSEIENMSADERMNVLTEALSGVDNKTKRATIGSDIFGGSWKNLSSVVDLGAEAMDKAKNSSNIISEDSLKKANDFRIKVEDMKEKLSFFVTEIGLKVLPILMVMFSWFETQMPKIKQFGENAFNLIETAMSNVSSFVTTHILPKFQELYSWAQTQLPKIKEFFLDTFEKAREVLVNLWKWLEPNLPLIREYFETAFGKVVEILQTFNDIIQNRILPALLEFWEWLEPHLPLIQSAFETSFNTIKDLFQNVIDIVGALADKINEHWAIVQPIIMAYAALIATSLIIQWIKLGIQATISAAKQVAAWLVTQVASVKAKISMVVTAALMVAKWVWMGAQAMFQAGRMAAAWLIAMGPVGWVIAGIIGLVALIILNWDKIVSATQWLGDKLSEIWKKTVKWITDKVDSLVDFFGGLKGKFSSAASGMFDGLKDAFKTAVNWIIKKWNGLQLKIGGANIKIPFGPDFSVPSVSLNTPNIPMFAKGVRNFGGGAAIVGEAGPELLNLPKGSDVYSNPETNSLLGGSNTESLLMELIRAVKDGGNIVLDGQLVEQNVSKRQGQGFNQKQLFEGR